MDFLPGIVGQTIANSLLKGTQTRYKMSLEKDTEVVSNLKFIGKIRKHYKINTSNLSLQPNNTITKLKRTFICYENNRYNALSFIERTLCRSFDIALKNATSEKISEKYAASNMITDIVHSLRGIDNLRHTYEDDIKYKCDLESLKQTTEARLREMHHNYPSLFSEDDIYVREFIGKSDEYEEN